MRTQARLRPEFSLDLAVDGARVLARIAERLADPDVDLVGQVVRGHAMLHLPDARSTLLSPILNLETIETDGASRLKGSFHPHPNVWTGFMALFGILGMLGLAGVMYGIAQMTVHETPWALWAGPVSVALIAFVYGAAFIGQGLSAPEMHEMRSFVECLVRDLGSGDPPPPG